jgi:acyl-coenzyme A thioesterase PaaI-like protein
VTAERLSDSFFAHMTRSDGGVGLCFGCRDLGRCRLGLTGERLLGDGTVEIDLRCPRDQEGGPAVAHGGWTAAVMDEALGHLPILNGQFAVTAELSIRYRRPVPVERPLRARSWVDRREGSRWYLSGELLLAPGGSVLAEASGVFVVRDPAHFARHEQWLSEQDASTAG